MKYCGKCGNLIEEDMAFCQKCGTKYIDKSTYEYEMQEKINRMKEYNLILEPTTITWYYLRETTDRTGKIISKQAELCRDLCSLIKDILSSTTEKNKDLIEYEVYTFVLKMGKRMCDAGEKLFGNYSGYEEAFKNGEIQVIRREIKSEYFLNKIMEEDSIYKATVGIQGLHASIIKEALDESVITENLEFRNLTIDLANAFNRMWYSCIRRYTDFFMSPGVDFINMNWNIYEIILKGLLQIDNDKLDENGWDFALDDWEKNHNGGQFKLDFNKKRLKNKEVRLKSEKEIADRKYWSRHPNDLKSAQEKTLKIVELSTWQMKVEKEFRELENNRKSIIVKKNAIIKMITNNETELKKLDKSIFGKSKAKIEIVRIINEVSNQNKELKKIMDELNLINKSLVSKNNEISNFISKINKLELEISNMRSET